MSNIRQYLRLQNLKLLTRKGRSSSLALPTKYDMEIHFWRQELTKYINWYEGKLPKLYETQMPEEAQKVHSFTCKDSAILTWFELHQKPKYLADLQLSAKTFKGATILDIGSGPMPSGETFEECNLYCLDPLLQAYLLAGYPIHCYRNNTRFVQAHSENIPFSNAFFDAIISVNAIDHVDDIYQTAKEIERVLKPDGLLRMHVHYHKPTPTEPLELSDDVMCRAFGWCANFRKLHTSDRKFSAQANSGESYNLWSNF